MHARYLSRYRENGGLIAKLDSPRFPQVAENELAILEWARTAGFAVPEAHLLPATSLHGVPPRYVSTDRKLLLIKRYDRRDGRRIHQEDFCQVVRLPPRLRYDHVTYEQLGGSFAPLSVPTATTSSSAG